MIRRDRIVAEIDASAARDRSVLESGCHQAQSIGQSAESTRAERARATRALWWLAKGPRTLSLTGRELPARHSQFLGAPRAQSRKRRIESGYGRPGAPSLEADQTAVQDFGRRAKRFAGKHKLGRRSWRRSDRGRSTAGRRRTPIDIANANTGHPKAADAFWRCTEAFQLL